MFGKKIVIIFILLIAWFFLWRYNSFTAPYERDEGEYAYSAWLLESGKGMPYKDSFLQKPPLIIYTYMLSHLISTDIRSARFLSSLSVILTGMVLFMMVKKHHGWLAAMDTVFIFITLISFPRWFMYAANTEVFLIFPAVACLYLYFSWKTAPLNWKMFAFGFLSMIALSFKPIAAPLLILILYLQRSLKNFILSFCGFFIAGILIYAPFLLNGAFPKLVEEIFIYNGEYIKAFGFQWSAVLHYINMFVFEMWPFAILFILFFVKTPKNWKLYLAFFAASYIAVMGSWLGHYYLYLAPFLAIILGTSLHAWIKNAYANLATLFLCVIIVMFQFIEQVTKTPVELSRYIYGDDNLFIEAAPMAAKLKKITRPEDFVYVVGSEPQIYYMADRISSSRFVITYPLIIPTSKTQTYQNELIADLKKRPPRAIVVSTKQSSGIFNEQGQSRHMDFIIDLLKKNYILQGSPEEDRQAGLLLFKAK